MLCYYFDHFIDGEAAVQGSLNNLHTAKWLVSTDLGI